MGKIIATNGWVLGEVALRVGFERWEAILPNTCYRLPFSRNQISNNLNSKQNVKTNSNSRS